MEPAHTHTDTCAVFAPLLTRFPFFHCLLAAKCVSLSAFFVLLLDQLTRGESLLGHCAPDRMRHQLANVQLQALDLSFFTPSSVPRGGLIENERGNANKTGKKAAEGRKKHHKPFGTISFHAFVAPALTDAPRVSMPDVPEQIEVRAQMLSHTHTHTRTKKCIRFPAVCERLWR